MMPDQPRDWDKELAAIDAAMAKAPPPAPAPGASAPATRPAAATPASPGTAAPVVRGGARTFLGAWLRALVGAALAIAVWGWPYAHACGLGLYGYLGAVLMVIVAGGWSSIASWRRRMGAAHVVSLLVLAAGLAFAVAQVLPRVGYARVPLTWTCP